MIVIVVDDEELILSQEAQLIRSCIQDCEVIAFSSAGEARNFVSRNNTDVAFIDVMLNGESGIELARELRKIKPDMNVIFTTAYSDYYADCVRMHASGYLLKPIQKEDVLREINDLRYPVQKKEDPFFIRCFGTFEVFYNGLPVKFKYLKSKEMLAYLVDRRGSSVTNEEIKSVLWDDDETSHDNYYKQIRKDLFDTLASIGQEDLIVKWRNSISVNRSKIRCDYYDFLDGKGKDSFTGEYMKQYEWAIYTSSFLERKYSLWTTTTV